MGFIISNQFWFELPKVNIGKTHYDQIDLEIKIEPL